MTVAISESLTATGGSKFYPREPKKEHFRGYSVACWTCDESCSQEMLLRIIRNFATTAKTASSTASPKPSSKSFFSLFGRLLLNGPTGRTYPRGGLPGPINEKQLPQFFN